MLPSVNASQLAEAQDSGSLTMPVYLVGDNKGVWLAVGAQNPKVATEPTLTPHIRGLRELVDKHMIQEILWCDNRDMIADPLTKGKTKRNVLNDVLDKAEWKVIHTVDRWPKTCIPRPFFLPLSVDACSMLLLLGLLAVFFTTVGVLLGGGYSVGSGFPTTTR